MKFAALSLLLVCLAWAFPCWGSEIVIIGVDEDTELYDPRQMEEGPDGNIYVYDRRTAFISVFSANGKHLRSMGGKGQGPGEIQRPDGVSFNFTYDKKQLYFCEFFGGHRWITFMELSGKFHRVIKLKMTKNYAISRSVPLKNGSFLAQAAFLCETGKTGDYYLYRCPTALIILNNQGETVSEILRTSTVERISLRRDGADLGIPFVPVFQWALLEGNAIAFTDGLGNALRVYSLDGKKTGDIKTPLPDPRPVTDRDMEKWRKNLEENFRDKSWFARFGGVVREYKTSIYDKKPNTRELSSTPDNHLLLLEAAPPGARRNKYWLLDKNGKTVTGIDVPGYNLRITRHFVFLIALDEEGEPMLRVMKRKENESESRSLQRFENLSS
jgi:hypothetical protein